MTKARVSRKGFTLVELIVVMAILAILAAVIVPSVTGYVQKAQDSAHQSNAQMVYSAAQLYLVDQDIVAGKLDSFTAETLVTGGYISPLPAGDSATLTTTVSDNGKVTITCTYQPKGAEKPIIWPKP